MISVLIPTRKRLAWLQRTVQSLRATASGPVEVVCYVDDDDPESTAFCEVLGVKCVVGPRIILTDCWNKCLPLTTGDIFQQGNDDVIYSTDGWDKMVEEEFAKYPDKILFVHGNDLNPNREPHTFGTHGFVHKRWVDTIGYFIPPYFSSDYGDSWNNELADALGRHVYIPFVIEHMHYGFGKAPMDQTTRDRLERHKADKVEDIWERTLPNRMEDIRKLREVINAG